MASSIQPFSWKNGFREPGQGTPWLSERLNGTLEEQGHYVTPPSSEILTSTVHNDIGFNVLRTWPTLYDGTSNPHGLPDWWQKKGEVDVLICGGTYTEDQAKLMIVFQIVLILHRQAGPSGLQVALSLARQGVSFRIIGKLCFSAAVYLI